MNASTAFAAATISVAIIGLAGACSAQADPLIANGGFEAGFAGWTTADQSGGDGTFAVQSGTTSPVNGDPVPAPPQGTNAAMTDAQGPGAHVLYQDFVVTSGAATTLTFDLFIGNRAGNFYNPSVASLAFDLTNQVGAQTLNQQARVDIMLGGSDPFSVAAADVLVNLYQTKPNDPLVSGYNSLSFDLSALFSAHAGETLRLRFAETDNVFIFQLGVDNVRIDVVPEPASTLLLGAGLLALFSAGLRGRVRDILRTPHTAKH